mmetsp:Transcript_57536/g.106283  ORF Transcript_57536/g.106283 Transcript_57536/m.106283 type:complete len:724 (-) Transcript_57536:8-2179(-)
MSARNGNFFEAVWKTAALCGEAPFCPNHQHPTCNEVVQPRRWDSQAEVAEEIRDPWFPSPDARPPSPPRLSQTSAQRPTSTSSTDECVEPVTQPQERWLHRVLSEASSTNDMTTTRPVPMADSRSRTRVLNPLDAAKVAAQRRKLARVQVDLSPVNEADQDSAGGSTPQVPHMESSNLSEESIQWMWTDDDFEGCQEDADGEVPNEEGCGESPQEHVLLDEQPEIFMASAADLAAGIPRKVSEGGVECVRSECKAGVRVVIDESDDFDCSPPPGEVEKGVLLYERDTSAPEDSSCDVGSSAEEGTVGCPLEPECEEGSYSPTVYAVASEAAPAPVVGSLAAAARGQLARPHGIRVLPPPMTVPQEQPASSDGQGSPPFMPPPVDAVDATAAPLPATVDRQRFLCGLKATDGQATFAPRRGRSPVRRDRGPHVTVCPAVAPGRMEPLAWLVRMQRLPALRLAHITKQRVLRAGLLRMDEALRARGNCTAAALEVAAGVAAELLQYVKATKMDEPGERTVPDMSTIASLSVCDTLLIRASTFDVLEPVRSYEPVLTKFLESLDTHLYMNLPSFLSEAKLTSDGCMLTLGVKIALAVGAAEMLTQGWGVGAPSSLAAVSGPVTGLPVTMPAKPSVPDFWLLDLDMEALALLNTKTLTLEAMTGTEDVVERCGQECVAIVRGQKQGYEDIAQVGVLDWEIFVVSPAREDLAAALQRARRVADSFGAT